MHDFKRQEDLITSQGGTLYGTAGGQLEFISLRFTTEQVETMPGKKIWQQFVILTFSDHDLDANDVGSLVDAGLRPFYELKFPIN